MISLSELERGTLTGEGEPPLLTAALGAGAVNNVLTASGRTASRGPLMTAHDVGDAIATDEVVSIRGHYLFPFFLATPYHEGMTSLVAGIRSAESARVTGLESAIQAVCTFGQRYRTETPFLAHCAVRLHPYGSACVGIRRDAFHSVTVV